MDIKRLPYLIDIQEAMQFVDVLTHTDLDAKQVMAESVAGLLPDKDPTLSTLVAQFLTIKSASETISSEKKKLLDSIDQEIKQLQLYTGTEDYFEQHLRFTGKYRSNWQLTPPQKDEVLARCSNDQFWKYPVTVINVQYPEFVSLASMSEISYLVDCDADLLKQVHSELTDVVQRRVRVHLVDEFETLSFDPKERFTTNLSKFGLPKEQMGTVICWNLFERYTMSAAQRNLLAIAELLRPGGQAIINFNDAETYAGSRMVADHQSSMITKHGFEQMLTSTGLELQYWNKVQGSLSVIAILKRPGTIQSTKIAPSRIQLKKSQ
jgi:hypothetical protein